MRLLVILSAGLILSAGASLAQTTEWPLFGHDAGGQRFSPLKQITPANVATLTKAWTYNMLEKAGDDAAALEVYKKLWFKPRDHKNVQYAYDKLEEKIRALEAKLKVPREKRIFP